jgi:hypothetical protein
LEVPKRADRQSLERGIERMPEWEPRSAQEIEGRRLEKVWWFNPRSGEISKSGAGKKAGPAAFAPPGNKASGNDWLLVLDNGAKNSPRQELHQ